MTADVTLTRFDKGDDGVFGRLVTGKFTCFTGELPERDNRTGESCILPPGTFRVVWAWSPSFRKFTYRLLDVPGRSGILIHSANLMGDRSKGKRAQLLGCIALGKKLGWMDGQKAVLISRPAVTDFEITMQRKPFILEVRDGHS